MKLESFMVPQTEEKRDDMRITFDDIIIETMRSSGHGGQNVNKRETKTRLRLNIDRCPKFTPEEKELLKQRLPLTKDGDFLIERQSRKQKDSKILALEAMNERIAWELQPEKERIATKPTKSSKEKRLQGKKERGEKKQRRQEKQNFKKDYVGRLR